MSFESSPRDSQRTDAAPRDSISGEVSSLIAATTTSYPCARAASSTRNGKRPLPAMRPSLGGGVIEKTNRGSSHCRGRLHQVYDVASDLRFRNDCHSVQISEAISEYDSSGPALPASNQRTNSSCTTRRTSSSDLHSRSRGKMVPVSGSYSSVFSFSNAIPIGSHRKRRAATESNI